MVLWPRPDLLQAPDNTDRLTNKPIPPDATIHTRIVPDVQVPDIESMPATYVTTGLMHLATMLEKFSKQIDDRSRPIDEYNVTSNLTSTASGANIELQPTLEGIVERIVGVLITGPAGSVTLQLGDRYWPLTVPAAGFLCIAPISIFLSHNDRRVLTVASAGNYSLELMGWADVRF